MRSTHHYIFLFSYIVQPVARRNITESFVYDDAGRKLRSTNGNNETTRYTYDLRGNIIATTLQLGQVTRSAYNLQGLKIAEVDANGSFSSWAFDATGRLSSRIDIGGATYSYVYDNARQLIQQTNTRGQNLAYGYDAAGQQIRITDNALGQVTTYAYNAAGQHVLEKTTARDQDLCYAYDDMNRQTMVDAAVTILQGQGHLIGYNANGERTSDTFIGTRITAGGGNSVQRRIYPQIGKRRTGHGRHLGVTRLAVERTFAWPHRFRRLRVRHERLADMHEGFFRLGCAVIWWRTLRKALDDPFPFR